VELSSLLLVPLEPFLLVMDSSLVCLVVFTAGTECDEGKAIFVQLSTKDVTVSLVRSNLELMDLGMVEIVVCVMTVVAGVVGASSRGCTRSRWSSSGGWGSILSAVVLLMGRLLTILVSMVGVVTVVEVVPVPPLELEDLLCELLDLRGLLDTVLVRFTVSEINQCIEDVELNLGIVLQLGVVLISQCTDKN
jgi:hypothetical protein